MELSERVAGEFGANVEVRAATAEDAIDGVVPRAVAAPRDEAAAQALLAWCGREKIALVPCGGRNRLHVGAPPKACDLVVSSHHLNAVHEHDEGNATITAGAGITLAALNAHVGQVGQFVPLDDALNGGTHTLGGAIATNASGMSKLKYGAPRDLVVGLSAALSDGRLVKAGSKVVKNVSGYDLNKIFIGSHGSLGLVTQVILRLRPHDAASATCYLPCADWSEAAARAQSVMDGAFVPTALRVTAQGGAIELMVRVDSVKSAVDVQTGRLTGAATVSALAPPTGDAPELVLRAHLPLQRAVEWVRAATTGGADRIEWDAGQGRVYASFAAMPAEPAAIVASLRRQAEAGEGAMVVERVPLALKTPDLVWGPARADHVLMQRLKAAYDGPGVCSPGRFAGGL